MRYGEYGEGVNTADCGSVMLGFESLYSPHIEINLRTLWFVSFYFTYIIIQKRVKYFLKSY